MFAHLQNQRVNLQLLQASYCQQLSALLQQMVGSKVIVLDEALVASVALLCSREYFQERQIELLQLTADLELPDNCENVIYLCRAQLSVMDVLAAQLQATKQKLKFHLVFVPRRSCLCIKHLEDKPIWSNFASIEELPWNFFPLDEDLLSMEAPHAYRDIYIDDDPSVLYQGAVALLQMQRLYGRIPKIYGKGNSAQCLWEYAKQLAADEELPLSGDKCGIDQLLLLDRRVDMLSALATQLTYEGLLDEFYGIQQNTLPLDLLHNVPTIGKTVQSATLLSAKKTKLTLNSSAELYASIRDKNFNEVGQILARTAKHIAQVTVKQQKQTVQDMKNLVDRLPALMQQKEQLSVHTSLAEFIRKRVDCHQFIDELKVEHEFMLCEDVNKACAYIEDLMGKKANLNSVLRLICMQCAAGTGLKAKLLNDYKRALVQVYGIKVLLQLSNLEKAGLLYAQTDTRSYAVLRKTFRLTVENAIEVEPNDISYVHSFYAPLTVRIVEESLKDLGWQSVKDRINSLAGQTFEDFQMPLVGIGGRQPAFSEGKNLNIPRVIMVFFVGGCTFAEIAALRFLAKQQQHNVQFVIATTKIINKNNFLQSVMN